MSRRRRGASGICHTQPWYKSFFTRGVKLKTPESDPVDHERTSRRHAGDAVTHSTMPPAPDRAVCRRVRLHDRALLCFSKLTASPHRRSALGSNEFRGRTVAYRPTACRTEPRLKCLSCRLTG